MNQEVYREMRRRIVKGAISTPAIFTLSTGAAFAATSLTCAERSQTLAGTELPPGFVTNPDKWVRKTLRVYRVQVRESASTSEAVNINRNWYHYHIQSSGEEKKVLNINGNSFRFHIPDAAKKEETANVQEAVNINGNWYQYPSASGPLLIDGIPAETDKDVFALVDYNSGAGAIWFPQPQTIINPIAGASCWTSLTGIALKPGNLLP